ncbi:hypothetical protein ACIPSE_46670 [Streptomyces sp. NPDC090106]|uniref:hypothetical protein n=1 Tax=Streptomyces sp. NPDC090106 TaxID=3365946 RepID=UPI0037F5921D
MPGRRPVIVYPPDEEGGRRVRIDGAILGRAFGLADVTEFLRRAGLKSWDLVKVELSDLIEWRGGGPQIWLR